VISLIRLTRQPQKFGAYIFAANHWHKRKWQQAHAFVKPRGEAFSGAPGRRAVHRSHAPAALRKAAATDNPQGAGQAPDCRKEAG
jgi:hypothetical protein